MGEQFPPVSRHQNLAQLEALHPSVRVYVVALKRDGWMERVFLEGKDTEEARDARALRGIHAPDLEAVAWPAFISRATAVLRQAGFVRIAH